MIYEISKFKQNTMKTEAQSLIKEHTELQNILDVAGYLNLSKGFDELILHGPKSESERQLLIYVDQYIPERKNEFILNKTKLSAVSAEIMKVIAVREQISNLINKGIEDRKKQQELDNNSQKQRQDPSISEKGILGAIFGGAGRIPSVGGSEDKNYDDTQRSLDGFARIKSEEEKTIEEKRDGNNHANASMIAELGGENTVIQKMFEWIRNVGNHSYEADPKLAKIAEHTKEGPGLLEVLSSIIRSSILGRRDFTRIPTVDIARSSIENIVSRGCGNMAGPGK